MPNKRNRGMFDWLSGGNKERLDRAAGEDTSTEPATPAAPPPKYGKKVTAPDYSQLPSQVSKGVDALKNRQRDIDKQIEDAGG